MTKKEKKSKKKKKSPSISSIILIVIGLVIIIAIIYYLTTVTKKEEPTTTNQPVGNYSIPTTNIDPANFVCPTQKYLNCMPPILSSNEHCKNPYRKWVSENCSEVIILE